MSHKKGLLWSLWVARSAVTCLQYVDQHPQSLAALEDPIGSKL